MVIVQGDLFNANRTATTVVVSLTSNQRPRRGARQRRPPASATELPRDSVANVSAIVSVDHSVLGKRLSKLPQQLLDRILAGIDLVLGRP